MSLIVSAGVSWSSRVLEQPNEPGLAVIAARDEEKGARRARGRR